MRLHQHPALEEKQRKTKPQQLRIQFFTGPPIHQYRRKQNNPETRKKTRKPNKHPHRTLPILPIAKQTMAPKRTITRIHSQKRKRRNRNHAGVRITCGSALTLDVTKFFRYLEESQKKNGHQIIFAPKS